MLGLRTAACRTLVGLCRADHRPAAPRIMRHLGAFSQHNADLTPEQNLLEVLSRLGATLPPAPPLGGLYAPVVRTGNYAYVSGQAPLNQDGAVITGLCSGPDDVAKAKDAAMWNALTMLATLKARGSCGDLGETTPLLLLPPVLNAAVAGSSAAAAAFA
jgi:enamine deaminase RidA (YjgF/YER057c/UK114 family)